MTSTANDLTSTTDIFLTHEANAHAHSIFNINNWTGTSRQIITSCIAQLGLLNYEVSRLPYVLKRSEEYCQLRFLELQKQWVSGSWNSDCCRYLVEFPEFHLYVQAYFSTIKTLLDFLAQLVSTEGIVRDQIHTFRKKNNDPGRKLINSLKGSACDGKLDTASKLVSFIEKQKEIWIDLAIELRDNLIHPRKGMYQITFALEIDASNENLELVTIVTPTVTGKDFHSYAHETLQQIKLFSKYFLGILKAG